MSEIRPISAEHLHPFPIAERRKQGERQPAPAAKRARDDSREPADAEDDAPASPAGRSEQGAIDVLA